MYLERRRKRSNFAGLALQYWFAAIAKRSRLFGLVLADSAGLLVASNIGGPEAEELAAIAPLVARPAFQPRAKMPMTVRQLQVDRTRLFLGAVGEPGQCHGALELAESGVQRILTTH